MTKKTVFGVMTVALVAIGAAPSSSANCIPAKSAATFGGAATAYWLPANPGCTPGAQSWQLGAPGTFQMSAACVAGQNGLFTDLSGLSLNLNLGDACAAGCPNGPIVTLGYCQGTNNETTFLLHSVAEAPGTVNFDYGREGGQTMIPIPRPRVLSSSKNLGNPLLVDLSLSIDSVSAGVFGPNAGNAITGYRILQATSATDPGRDATPYAQRVALAAAGGGAATTPLQVDCTDQVDKWLVTQIVFENGSVLSSAVSGATRVNCNPALANPKTPKIKVAPKAAPRSISN